MLRRFLKLQSGPLTRDLIQQPGHFGLGRIPSRLAPSATTTSICGYCATGCQLKIHLNDRGEAINLTPQASYPVNLGMACPKGWQALDPLNSPDRATTPLLRNAQGTLTPVSWDQALDAFTSRLKSIQSQHGPESVAFLSTGQIPLEEMAFLGCLFKFGMGFLHGDANTRQCMATAVTAYKQSFGFDAPPACYADLEESDTIILIGANLCIAHPILWQRVMRNQRNPTIIVIDPRSTETAQAAHWHIPLKPKGDLHLLYSLAHCILRDGRVDRSCLAHTEGINEFSDFVRDFTPQKSAEACGISPESIEKLALLASDPTKRVSWWWTMGVNQSHEGVRVAQAIINLCLITGNIGRPGTGPSSITGQCNAMGSRLFSNTTSLVGGHDFQNEEHRRKVALTLGIPLDSIPSKASLAYDEILARAESGAIKALWIVATNPFHSWINSGRLARLRDKLDFLIVQDMYTSTESALAADLLLPAAGWGEKTGCFINSERRIGTIKHVRSAPGSALSDFRIFRLIAHAWGCEHLFQRWESPEHAFQLLRDLTRNRPCDITGIENYDMIDRLGGIQWPFPASHSTPPQERRLFEDMLFFTPDQKARILFSPPTPLPEPADSDFPFTLLTGRGSSSQWHTQSRTSKSPILRKLSPNCTTLEIHPADAHKLGIQAGDMAIIRSRRGEMKAIARPSHTISPGQVFLPMHDPGVNRLTHASFDPHSRQPNYKACAVSVRRCAKS